MVIESLKPGFIRKIILFYNTNYLLKEIIFYDGNDSLLYKSSDKEHPNKIEVLLQKGERVIGIVAKSKS